MLNLHAALHVTLVLIFFVGQYSVSAEKIINNECSHIVKMHKDKWSKTKMSKIILFINV
jgi:hypothetical protein